MKRVFLLVFVLASCVPANTPNELAALADVRQTAQAQAVGTQAASIPITQSYEQSQLDHHATEAAFPAASTATALALATQQVGLGNAQARATYEALGFQNSITGTLEALEVLDSNTQRTIADNNRAMADSIRWGNFWQSVLEWGALIILFSLSTSAAWGVIQFGLFAHTYRTERETELRRQLRMRIYRESLREANKDGEQEFLLTTAGPMVKTHSVITIADKHIENYQRANNWRAVCKTYIQSCIHLERGGVRQPYSRPNCLTYELIQDPATGGAWQLGHERVVGLLRAVGVIDNTGKGGATRLIVDASEYARVIDLAPLPKLPPDPIPHAKIIVAGWQAAQVSRLAG